MAIKNCELAFIIRNTTSITRSANDHIIVTITIHVTGKAHVADDLCPRLYALATAQQWPLRELHRDTRTLEDVFNELATSL